MNTRGVGRIRDSMQTRDEVEGFHNCPEFPQPLACLYQAMQTQEKSFLLLFTGKKKQNSNLENYWNIAGLIFHVWDINGKYG